MDNPEVIPRLTTTSSGWRMGNGPVVPLDTAGSHNPTPGHLPFGHIQSIWSHFKSADLGSSCHTVLVVFKLDFYLLDVP